MIYQQGQTPPALSKTEISDKMITQVDSYFSAISKGRLRLTGDVYGWYPLQVSYLCDLLTVSNIAVQAADNDVYYPNYDAVVLLAPQCLGQGATGSSWSFTTQDGPVSLYVSIIGSTDVPEALPSGTAHELLHDFGLNHGDRMVCPGVAIATSGCQRMTHGDAYSLMGGFPGFTNLDAVHMDYTGWFDAGNLATISQTGIYDLVPMGADSTALKAIRIPRGDNDYLYVDYRQPVGVDMSLAPIQDALDGAFAYVRGPLPEEMAGPRDSGWSMLIDASPLDHSGFDDVLRIGQCLFDPASSAAIRVMNISPAALRIAVDMPVTGCEALPTPSPTPSPSASVMPTPTPSASATPVPQPSPTPTPSSQSGPCSDPAIAPWPSNWARPCPIFTVQTSIVTSNSGSLLATVIPPAGATVYTYATAYVYEPNWNCPGKLRDQTGNLLPWCPFTLTGIAAQGTTGFFSGNASLSLPAAILQNFTRGIHYIAEWDWTWDQAANGGQGCWKGPGSSVCYDSQTMQTWGNYRLQTFDVF